ncbi:MAG: hypothetical protein AAB617_03210 [Patescibacteria group bacterium]
MKLFRNPFFYTTLLLSALLIFQISNLVSAAWGDATEPFPGGNPAAPLDTSASTQSKLGVTFTQSAGVNRLTLDSGLPIYGTNGSAAQPAYIPRTSSGESIMIFDGAGFSIRKFGSATDILSVTSAGNVEVNGSLKLGAGGGIISGSNGFVEVFGSGLPTGSGLLLSPNDVALWGKTRSNVNTRLIFLGNDDNTYINAPATGQIKFRIADSDKIAIDDNGVGIGTLSPRAKLHVAGNIRVDTPTDNTANPPFKKNLPITVNGVTYLIKLYQDPNTPWLYGAQHTEANCTDLGGTVTNHSEQTCDYDNTGQCWTDNYKFCKLPPAPTCPGGWNQFLNYRATTAKSCSGVDVSQCTGATSCTTGSHVFADTPTEQCGFYNEVWTITGTSAPVCSLTSGNCAANVTQVGCY